MWVVYFFFKYYFMNKFKENGKKKLLNFFYGWKYIGKDFFKINDFMMIFFVMVYIFN